MDRAAAVAFALIVAACQAAPESDPSAVASPSASPSAAIDDLRYSCDVGHPPFGVSLLDQPAVDLETTAAGSVLSDFIAGEHDADLLPADGWRLVELNDGVASFVAISEDVLTASARLELSHGEWRVVNWAGGCAAHLVGQEVNAATWTLVPGQEITASTTAFLADVKEVECAGGRSSEDRLYPPEIRYDADVVLVTFTVEPPPGEVHTCMDNPSSRVRVELAEPLGDRRLLDGGTLPWSDPQAGS